MKKLLLGAALLVSGLGVAQAQEGLQVGANLGATMGLSVKYNMQPAHAIEGIMGYNINKHGIAVKAMYQYHVSLVDALSLYMGGGVNIGGYYLNSHGNGDFAFGIVPTVGLEYKIKTAPIGLAFGYEPAINFTSSNTWTDVAFKLRYCF